MAIPSEFPANLLIGQAPQVSPALEELHIDKPRRSSLPKRLRDRDEDIKDTLSLGASAPRGVSAKVGLRVRGVKLYHHHQYIHKTGLSAANESATTLTDLAWWQAGGILIAGELAGMETVRQVMVRAHVPVYGYTLASVRSHISLWVSGNWPTVPLTQVGFAVLVEPLLRNQAGSGFGGNCGDLVWAGQVGPGTARFVVRLQSFAIPYFGAGIIQTAFAPVLSALLV